MPEPTSRNKPKALLVEDEFLLAIHVKELLQQLGFEVVGPARRVDEAIRLLQSQSNLAIAILDIDLAGEMVWPVARALLKRSVPFILVTGYHQGRFQLPPDLSESKLLLKPLDERDLEQTIRALHGI